ncbi:MAG: hypothetical protein KIT02_07090 [Devosia sp.]|uniref:hypothetical protein n=1 Tax=Devosia sp. TaxID=1871048 RepID=UPI0024CCC733|nr:hypothetical protein [Devosia sp.]UYO00960.1 MAG: hypothetical protein KIT02_07090 [Devosia sp.]
MIRIATTAALLLGTSITVQAQTLDEEIAGFIHAPGFVAADIEALETRLADQWLDLSVMTPGGTVGPIEKAMIIADTFIESGRTRTAISYGEIIGEDGTPVSFIELRHFNLGPAIHAETVAAYGAENTADVEEFGRGDHIAWRMVFQPVMNNSAMLVDASSRVLSDKDARKSDCTGRPCLDLAASFDDEPWEDMEGRLPSWPELYSTQSDETTTPAHAIAQLAVLGFWANAESGAYQWTGGEHPEAARGTTPYRFIGIDRNLGQEAAIDTVWRETLVNDDSITAIAFRRAEIAGEAYLMRSSRED